MENRGIAIGGLYEYYILPRGVNDFLGRPEARTDYPTFRNFGSGPTMIHASKGAKEIGTQYHRLEQDHHRAFSDVDSVNLGLSQTAAVSLGRLKIPSGTDGSGSARRSITLNFIVPY